MDKVLEALKKLLPAEEVNEVAKAVQDVIEEAKQELTKEFEKNLQEAYTEAAEKISQVEAEGYQGYEQALMWIKDLELRNEAMQQEHDNELEEGFEEAWKMYETEKAKNNNLEVEIYKEFENKLQQMQQFIVEKLSVYMEMNNAEIYENARRAILNDPREAERRVALEKIAETVAGYMSEDDMASSASRRLEEAYKQIEELRSHFQISENRNARLSKQNNLLNEQAQEARRERDKVLTESVNAARKESEKVVGTASGRGQKAMGMQEEKVLAEFVTPEAKKPEGTNDVAQPIVENADVLNDLLVLAGVRKPS